MGANVQEKCNSSQTLNNYMHACYFSISSAATLIMPKFESSERTESESLSWRKQRPSHKPLTNQHHLLTLITQTPTIQPDACSLLTKQRAHTRFTCWRDFFNWCFVQHCRISPSSNPVPQFRNAFLRNSVNEEHRSEITRLCMARS